MDEVEAAEIRRIRTRLEIGAMDAHEACQALTALLAKSAQLADPTVSAPVPADKRVQYGQ